MLYSSRLPLWFRSDLNKAMPFFTHSEAEAFAAEAVRPLSDRDIEAVKTFKSGRLRCIDDRSDVQPIPGSSNIAIPGGGLGLVMDTIAGVELLRSRSLNISISYEMMVSTVEKVIGTPSYHTDEKSSSDPLVCKGCGHCTGALKDPSGYLLSWEAVVFLKETYIPELAQRQDSDVYPGPHDAKAVFVIPDLDLGMRSQTNGNQAYVYHKGWHEVFLSIIAAELGKELPGVSVDEIEKSIKEAAQSRLSVTVNQLAPEHPKFLVTQDTKGVTVIDI